MSNCEIYRITQKLLLAFFVLLLIGCSRHQLVDHQRYQLAGGTVLIKNINVLSSDEDRMLSNHFVFIENGHIAEVSAKAPARQASTVIDGTGKYLIPGLVESHAHLNDNPNDLLVYLAHGVTTIREMSGNDRYLAWRREINEGRTGPNIYLASEKVASQSGISGYFDSLFGRRLHVSTEEQASELVIDLVNKGYDSVKTSSFISAEMYKALTESADKNRLQVVGHLPMAVSLKELWQSHHQELAHVEEITKSLNREFGGYTAETAHQYLEFVRARSNEVALRIKQHDIAVGTTLWFMESLTRQALELNELIKELDLTLAAPDAVKSWMPGKNPFELTQAQQQDPEVYQRVKIEWDTYVAAIYIMLEALVQNDVRILAGTDSMTSLVVPGVSMHQELQSLVESGIPPAKVLSYATDVPGNWMQKSIGRIESGFIADLVILNANPLADIRNTQAIDTVIFRGKVLNRATIDDMLSQVKVAYGHTITQ